MKEEIERILPLVRKPARYTNNELNSIHKDWSKIGLKVALAYPDTYEIGMSNTAIQILYFLINQLDYALAERVFSPWPDFEAQLSAFGYRLSAIESQRPLSDFDLIGMSLGHELTYTNVVNMLHLGGVPIYAKDRTDKDPLVMAGGPCTFNPEPVSDFFDFFVIGEGEETIIQILTVLNTPTLNDRRSTLYSLSQIPGIYVPGINTAVKKQIVKDFNNIPYPTKPIVPLLEAIHDRAVVEIMRGCPWGCKFCQAGWTSRPVRQRSPEKVEAIADELIKNTGYDEVSLVSLSSSDYKGIDVMAKKLADKYAGKRINVSLPSLRTNTFSVELAKAISQVRPSSLTIAPEAGTQRLRDLIGKRMSEQDIEESINMAFDSGIEAIKLYFMTGLPTETDEDLIGICELAKKILKIGKAKTNRARVTINLATFIPKPQTPFQWEAMITIEESLRRQDIIKAEAKAKGLQVKWHQAESSWLEGIFARGDKQLARVIVKAWELGARLDAWYEHFKVDLWRQAFVECGIDPNEYLKARDKDKPLPWDYIEL